MALPYHPFFTQLTEYALERPSMGHHVQLVEGVSSGVGVSAVMAAVYHASEVFMREHVPGGKILYRAAGA